MVKQRETQERCVVGAVKFRLNRDNSVTFTIAGKSGKRFTLAKDSKHAQTLFRARRAIVRYEDSGRNPRVLLVLENPTGYLISQHTSV